MIPSILKTIRTATYATYIDSRLDFARSFLGTGWHTIGLMIAIGILGTFFGAILQDNLPEPKVYIPYLALGLFIWACVAGALNRACAMVRTQGHALRAVHYPFAAIGLTALFKSSLLFVQDLILAASAYWVFVGPLRANVAALVFGTALLLLNTLWMGQLAALAAARFRDFPQLLSAALYLGFLVTPIFWMEHFVGRFEVVFQLNPAYHLVSIVRLPFLGQPVPVESWLWGTGILAVGSVVTVIAHRMTKYRTPYWL